jgi:DNA-binding transcriptional regulator LsrR (DeoR family)
MPLQLSYRLAIFYAANPDMKLTGQELARKFGHPSKKVLTMLRASRDMGIVTVQTRGPGDNVVSAGPALLDEL